MALLGTLLVSHWIYDGKDERSLKEMSLYTWSPYHHQRVAVNGHMCSQVGVIAVMDLVQNTAMSAVLRSQVLEVQSILMDHILSRRRFAVSAGVGVISILIWNPMAFQSIVVSRPSRPDRRTILSAREGWQPQLP